MISHNVIDKNHSQKLSFIIRNILISYYIFTHRHSKIRLYGFNDPSMPAIRICTCTV